MPAVLDRPSGTLEMKTAASIAGLTAPPANSPTPRTTDSGMPSMSAPTAMAVPLPGESFSVGWGLLERFRCFAPARARRTLDPTKISAPRRKPRTVGSSPPPFTASSTSFIAGPSASSSFS